MNHEYISKPLSNYNQTLNTPQFSILDALILDTVLSDAYKTDQHLATTFMCSLSTIKRSINKLCLCGFLTKHLAKDNTKSLHVNKPFLDQFLEQWK